MNILGKLNEFTSGVKEIGKIELLPFFKKIEAEVKELTAKIERLEKENTQLKERLKMRGLLVYKNGVYIKKDEKGNLTDEVFCCRCYDSENKPIHLMSYPGTERQVCPECRLTSPPKQGRVLK